MILGRLVRAIVSVNDERHGPLPPLLLVLTLVTGLVDAVSYLALGHVFVANMTGNVIFLGFAVADAQEFSIPASLVAMAAFLVGALLGGRLGTTVGNHRGRLFLITVWIEVGLMAATLAVAVAAPDTQRVEGHYGLIVLLAVAMGVQNATARRLGVPDLTTTVLTLTLTGLAADSPLAGGNNPRPLRRITAAITMFLGAGIGAALLFRFGVAAVLAVALALLGLTAMVSLRLRSSSAPWTKAAA